MPAQIKCEFCGGYIKETDAYCPNCGAANNNLKRSSSGTPKTIEDLQKWYTDHNLPPEEVTRFFIGKDIKEAKAFGIYRKNKNVVVYKNKADGSRVVRYEGEDEAYAVREIFLKLKEEILNQKNINAAKKNGKSYSNAASSNRNNHQGVNTYSKPSRPIAGTTSYKHKRNWAPLIVILVIVALFAGCFGISQRMNQKVPVNHTYYYSDADGLYYYENHEYQSTGDYKGYTSRWWKYDEDTDDWVLERYKREEYPDGLTYKDKLSEANKPGYSYVDILDSIGYKDSKHPKPKQGYYYLKDTDTAYYYLDDYFGENYCDSNDTGWYVETDDGWEVLGPNSKETIPEVLWYDADSYYWDENNDDKTWEFSDFKGTQWFDDYIDHYNYYKENNVSNSSYSSSYDDDDDSYSSWDDDDDWSWDDDDDWSSDYTDWDSDW